MSDDNTDADLEAAADEWEPFGRAVVAYWRSHGCDCEPRIIVRIAEHHVNVSHMPWCALAPSLSRN